MSVTNPAPFIATNIVVTSAIDTTSFAYLAPADLDFIGIKIHMSLTPGFTSDDDTLIFEGLDNPAVISGLVPNTEFFFRITSVDGFGDGGQTLEASFTTTQLPAGGIADGAVTTPKLDDGAVTTPKLDDDAVTEVKIVDNAITETKITANAVTTPKIAANAVTANEIAANTITAAEIAALTITAAQIAANTITASEISAGTITANEIAALTITASEIAVNGVTADKININSAINITTDTGAIYSGKATFASTAAGWWVGRDSGVGKLHFGNAVKSFKWDGTDLEIVGGFKTSSGSGQRVEISDSSNEMLFFADRGDGTVDEVLNIGVSNVAGDDYFLEIGSNNASYSKRGMLCRSGTNVAAAFFSGGAICIEATSANNSAGFFSTTTSISASIAAVVGLNTSATGRGVQGVGNTIGVFGQSAQEGVRCETTGGTGANATPLRIVASASASAPTHSAAIGSMWVTSVGVLYINTSGSTTWQKVGAQ
jgi:hypothetical protein